MEYAEFQTDQLFEWGAGKRTKTMALIAPIKANGRSYEVPNVCATVICLDGCEPAYLEVAIERGLMPNLNHIIRNGTSRIAHSVIPSFTNLSSISLN